MFNSQSQAKQDVFVHTLLPISNGRFLDIGSHDPIRINNTYALEQLGWTGYLFDIDERWAVPTKSLRTSPFVCADVAAFDWNSFMEKEGLVGSQFDYLSFDVDEASLATLERFPFDKLSFRVCTIEHDSYRFGTARAERMREILGAHGYRIVCKDVKNMGNAYEDWYIHTSVPIQTNSIECQGLEWTDVIQRLQTNFQAPSSALRGPQ
jgi:hypothetical protein